MIERRVWLGKPAFFKAECEKLYELLTQSATSSLSIMSDDSNAHDWILSPNLLQLAGECSEPVLSVYTSGTTGDPKKVVRPWGALLKQKRGRGKITDRWLLTFSPTRWAGLSVMFHCLKTGAQLVIPASTSPADILAALPKATHLSLTPSLFRKLILSGSLEAESGIVQVTFGGEPASQRTLDDAREIWPQARISHIYASTELGDISCESDGKEGFSYLPGELTDQGELIIDGVRTGDLWDRRDGRFLFIGRATEMINVGGAKVFPGVVEHVLLAIDGVDECRVFGEASPLLGQLVCAEYIGKIEPKELLTLIRSKLPKVAVPRLTRVSRLALNPTGKMERR